MEIEKKYAHRPALAIRAYAVFDGFDAANENKINARKQAVVYSH